MDKEQQFLFGIIGMVAIVAIVGIVFLVVNVYTSSYSAVSLGTAADAENVAGMARYEIGDGSHSRGFNCYWDGNVEGAPHKTAFKWDGDTFVAYHGSDADNYCDFKTPARE